MSAKMDEKKKKNTEEEGAKSVGKQKLRIMRNVIVVSFGFTLLFTAYQSMASLQSSINSVDGLGTWSLSTIYAALVVSSMFLPTYLIKRFSVKWTMCASMLCYSAYIAAQFYPEFYTLIPGGIILGLGAAPMWSAKCTYLTQIAMKYSELSRERTEAVIVRFFGIFFLFFQSSSVFGNLIVAQVLGRGDEDANVTDDALAKCGINFCASEQDDSDNENLDPPPKSRLYTLSTIYLISSFGAALLIATLLDPLTKYGELDRTGPAKSNQPEGSSGLHHLLATFRHMKHPFQLLVIPLTMWSGVEQGYFTSEFTRAYVSCAWGTPNIGYVMLCFGVVDALSSYCFGYVIKLVGRIPVFILGAALNAGCIVTFYLWGPNPDEVYVFFVIAGVWGMADAIWQTQINAFYGVLFPESEEAAFSNYRLWESIGFILAYALNNLVCVRFHTTVVATVLGVGMAGYMIIEVIHVTKKKQYNVHNKKETT
ncbi:unnamed protein product [Cyprideis torosa]|uniref:Uncharacterized protein n=1 Tax=Cyprideis torosa TaxID=163714 RepID=A0A7R8W7F0_9CRUS|nr:unnamed protein product [Cyprideis torosa]CAG0883173.1 unnamed protein product [Cyprideis torosa]